MDDIRALAQAKLASSGITVKQAQYANISAYPATKIKTLYENAPSAPALQINYLSPGGKPTSLYRLRILQPVPGVQVAKPQRYFQPSGTEPQVYFPRVEGIDWLSLLSNPSQPLVITEGELKALSATLHGVPTIGLGGVWNWKSAKRGIDLLDDLKVINWEGRDTYIAYDSDAVTKPDVNKAQMALAAKLSEYGAMVYDAGMPMLGEGADKVGLDDFIVLRGVDALREHLSHAEPVDQVLALHEFNERFLIVRELVSVLERKTDTLYDMNAFVNNVAANEHFETQVFDKKGNATLVRKPLAKAWREWPKRAEVLKLDYEPGKGQILQPGPRYNKWKGWGLTPKQGPVKLWNQLLDYMFSNEPTSRTWFEQWLAYPLQYPGTKLFTAVAVWGTQGTGKTLIGETMLKIYGGNGILISQLDLDSSFNDWIDCKQFIVGDEVTGNESRKHADQLKGLVTSSTINVNRKFQRRYELPNRANFYFTSNHSDAFFLDDNDRRFFVVETPTAPMEKEFYDQYHKWLTDEGATHLFFHLLKLDTASFSPRAAAMQTKARTHMIEDNKSDIGTWVWRLKNDPSNVLPQINGHAPREFFSSLELMTFYDPQGIKRVTVNGLGREMKRAGFVYINDGLPIRCEGHPLSRYYAVLNREKWRKAKTDAITLHLKDHKFGQKDKY